MLDSSSSGGTESDNATRINHVVCAIDSHMVYALAVLLASLRRNASQPFIVTVGYLEESLPPTAQDFITKFASFLSIRLDFLPLPHLPEFITQGHISPTTFAKFLLADYVQDAHLWIDADTVGLPGWDAIFDDIYSTSEDEGLVVSVRSGKRTYDPTKPSTLAFNAGVLGWPEGQRRNWREPLSSLARVETQEQFLFNQLYATTARRIPEKYNLLTYRIDVLDTDDMPRIIHYAGAHKPWHLRRDLSQACLDYSCPWSAWFEAEKNLFEETGSTQLNIDLRQWQREALRSGRVRLRRDHGGYNFLRILTAAGPLGSFVKSVVLLLKQWIPRGTHPIH